jgi:uncharacterized membrane protein required for colicin V production
MWLDLLALGLFAALIGLGAWRGGFVTGMALLALVAGYAASVLGSAALAPYFEAALGVPKLVALPLAGTALFFVGYLATGLLHFGLRRAGFGEDEPGPTGRLLGAVFGAFRGALVVLLIAYLALWLDVWRAAGRELPVPPVDDSLAARATGAVVEAGVAAALDDEGATSRMMARIAGQPAHALTEWQAVVDAPSVTALRQDAPFWRYVEAGHVEVALARPDAIRMMRDDALRARLAKLGVVSDAAARDPGLFRDDLIAVLREVGPRVRSLREDPELQKLIQDPEVVALAQSGDTMGLLAHPGFRALVERVAATP